MKRVLGLVLLLSVRHGGHFVLLTLILVILALP